ncbi:LCP family protein [Glutamicibacter ardleyensis]|uniref:LCP family protein n=1 Tax=Glutamicibacter ardleyensis TaxID=225894 RepID=UPI003FD63788
MSFEEKPRRRKRKHTGRNTLLVILSLVVIAGLVAGGYVWNLGRSFDSKSEKIVDAFPAEETRPEVKEESKDALNILLLGSDTRAVRDEGDSEEFATLPSGGRSDTMMLVHVPSNRKSVYVTSIMRDTWLDIPGVGTAKINRAFASGGVPKAVETLEGLFGVRINHVASVDFEGFKGLTDAVGGVTINNPIAFSPVHAKGYFFPEGTQTLDGEEALVFVRERKAFTGAGGSDYRRVKNQQLFVKALLGQIMSKDTLSNPAKVSNVVNEMAPFIAVDESLNAGKIAEIASSMISVRPNDMEFFTLPNKGPGRSADGQSIVIPDMETIDKFGTALQNDTVDEFVASTDLSQ